MKSLRFVLPALLLSTAIGVFSSPSHAQLSIWVPCSSGKAKAEGRTEYTANRLNVNTVGMRVDDIEDAYCVTPAQNAADKARVQRERQAKEKREQAERTKREQEEKAFRVRAEWAQARMDESVKAQTGQALKEAGLNAQAVQAGGTCKWLPARQSVFRGADTEEQARAGVTGRSPICLGGGKASMEGVKCSQIKGFHPIDAKGKTDWNAPAKVRYDCEAVYVCERGKQDCGPAKPSGASRQ